ncbi:exosortase B [Pseudoduganella flava]|uniref:Exosortase B n=1 Tax=Pseudoduganella flava TaxID=871742 RepID=A0A562Q6Y5_9BURK|nr:exosortase B [Pseudoduganella flava]QGZ41782.1 exosortase B [Pseudoduganella flava]TWI51786.1 exosortase B [Pseudoduganella flava]
MDMANKLQPAAEPQALRKLPPELVPIVAGMALLLVPTLYRLFTGAWASEEQAHGPIILALSLWLMWRNLPTVQQLPARPSAAGWPVLVVSLLLYVLGRSQQILSFEILSLQGVAVALLLLRRGFPALRVQWFPFFFMLFLVPLPGTVVSALTMPMKMAVSYVTEHLLYAAGYPIARSGVILQIGQYQLLVADACAGLQTLLTLEALGLFYLNVVRHTSAFRNLALALLIIPISFTANVIRVITLTLVTFYLGDAAGQGFLHGFAGMVLFVSALILILSIDSLLQWVVRRRERQGAKA